MNGGIGGGSGGSMEWPILHHTNKPRQHSLHRLIDSFFEEETLRNGGHLDPASTGKGGSQFSANKEANNMSLDGSIKIGDEIFSSFNVSKHSPLGILVVKVFAYQGWRWLVTNDTDVRNGYVQHVRCRANGGWFTLSFAGVKSAKIQWDATILELDTFHYYPDYQYHCGHN